MLFQLKKSQLLSVSLNLSILLAMCMLYPPINNINQNSPTLLGISVDIIYTCITTFPCNTVGTRQDDGSLTEAKQNTKHSFQ